MKRVGLFPRISKNKREALKAAKGLFSSLGICVKIPLFERYSIAKFSERDFSARDHPVVFRRIKNSFRRVVWIKSFFL